jgi:hypothetical protein
MPPDITPILAGRFRHYADAAMIALRRHFAAHTKPSPAFVIDAITLCRHFDVSRFIFIDFSAITPLFSPGFD